MKTPSRLTSARNAICLAINSLEADVQTALSRLLHQCNLIRLALCHSLVHTQRKSLMLSFPRWMLCGFVLALTASISRADLNPAITAKDVDWKATKASVNGKP